MKSFIQIYKENAIRLGELQNANTKFKKVLSVQSKKYEQELISYRNIIQILFNCDKLFDIELKYEIFNAIKEKDIDLLYDLTSECIVIGGFSFIINEEEGTASLFYTMNSGKEIFFPNKINMPIENSE